MIGLQSDAVSKQLNENNQLIALDLQINCLTQQIKPKDMILTCSSLAVFGLNGDSDSIKDQFHFIFGSLQVPGGLLSESYVMSMETVELKRASSTAKVVVIAAKNQEVAIKISSTMQTMLRNAIDEHGGRDNASNPFKASNVSAFFERSLTPLRSALLQKAAMLKETFSWIKLIRLQVERRQLRIVLIVVPVDKIKDVLKRGNFLPYAEIPIGMALPAMAHHDNIRFRKMRDSNVNPPRGAAALEPVVPMSDSDNFDDEIDLRRPSLPAAMDTSAPYPPTLPIPVSRPSTTGSAPVPISPPPTSTEFKQPRVSRGRTKSKSVKDHWALEPSPK